MDPVIMPDSDLDGPARSVLSLREYLRVAYSCRRAMTTLVVAVVGLAVLFSFLQDPTYRSSAEVTIRTVASDSLFRHVEFEEEPLTRFPIAEQQFAESAIVRDEVRAKASVEPRLDVDLKLAGAARIPSEATVLVFSAITTDAASAAAIAQTYADRYIDSRSEGLVAAFEAVLLDRAAELDREQARYEELVAPIVALDEDIASASSEDLLVELLRNRAAAQESVAAAESSLVAEIVELEQAYERLEALHAALRDRELSAFVSRAAETPTTPITPNWGRNLAVGLLLGLTGAAILPAALTTQLLRASPERGIEAPQG